MLNNELINKYIDVVSGQSPLIILESKPDVCMDNNGKDTKHTHKLQVGYILQETMKSSIYKRQYGVREV